jgi:hypothetical protein
MTDPEADTYWLEKFNANKQLRLVELARAKQLENLKDYPKLKTTPKLDIRDFVSLLFLLQCIA